MERKKTIPNNIFSLKFRKNYISVNNNFFMECFFNDTHEWYFQVEIAVRGQKFSRICRRKKVCFHAEKNWSCNFSNRKQILSFSHLYSQYQWLNFMNKKKLNHLSFVSRSSGIWKYSFSGIDLISLIPSVRISPNSKTWWLYKAIKHPD